jgi:hypothetical protein
MGAKLAQEIAESPLTLEEKLSWHLRGNLYPPLPDSLVPVCVEAITLAENGEDLHKVLTMPPSVKRAGKNEITAKQLILSTKLHFFIKSVSLEFVEDYN